MQLTSMGTSIRDINCTQMTLPQTYSLRNDSAGRAALLLPTTIEICGYGVLTNAKDLGGPYRFFNAIYYFLQILIIHFVFK